MEGEPQSSPFKEFRQFYFGSLLRDIITLPGEWPHLHFEPGLTAQIDRPGRLSIPQICPFHYRVQWLAAKEFTDGAPSLIYGHVGIGAGAGIGVCDGHLAERLPANDPGLLLFFPVGIEQRIRREGVTVHPAIDGDALNIPRRVESSSTQHAAQLVADVSVEFREGRLQQLRAPGAILVPLRQSGRRGAKSTESHNNRSLVKFSRLTLF